MNNVTPLDAHRAPQTPPPATVTIENEQAVLGTLLMDNNVFFGALSELKTEHFSEEIHRRIFDVCDTLIKAGKQANPVTLRPYLGDHDLGDGLTVSAYLARLCRNAVPPMIAATHVHIVIEFYNRRQLIEIVDRARAVTIDPPPSTTSSDLIDKIEEDLAKLRADSPTQKITRGEAGDFAEKLFARAEERRLGTSKDVAGVTTGIPSLDRDTGGLVAGNLWIVGGRPGMGKTVMGTSLARAAAASGSGAKFFSLEVPEEQITARFVADIAYNHRKPISFGAIMQGHYDDTDAERIWEAGRRLKAMPLIIDCASRLTVSQIAARVRAERLHMAKRGMRLGVVVLDYLKFVSASDRYAGQRHYEVGEISAGCKQLAKDQDTCVVLLAQLNRGVESRDDKRPNLADLRESGDLEADADVVAFMYREVYYLERSSEFRNGDAQTQLQAADLKHDLELIVAKNRAGPSQTYKLFVDVSCSTISARAREGEL